MAKNTKNLGEFLQRYPGDGGEVARNPLPSRDVDFGEKATKIRARTKEREHAPVEQLREEACEEGDSGLWLPIGQEIIDRIHAILDKNEVLLDFLRTAVEWHLRDRERQAQLLDSFEVGRKRK